MRKKGNKIYPTSLWVRFLVFVFFTLFAWRYRISKQMPENVRKLRPPYLVLGNHVGFWDPFVTGNFLPHFVHFVSSDAAFRNPVFRFFLTRLGTIPKKKNMRDTRVIRDILGVLRQGESVGIFPEAVRNWAGSSFPLDPSIVKLIRMAGVPVVVPVLKGMNLFNPRWSKKLRRARVAVIYQLLFTLDDVKSLSADELFVRLSAAIAHDEVDYQRSAMIPIRSNKKAEHISFALYVCPNCYEIDTFRCQGDHFHCAHCGYDLQINRHGFFERISPGEVHFDNIRDWYYWQEQFLSDLVQVKMDRGEHGPLLTDTGSAVYAGNEKGDLVFQGRADVSLYADHILIDFTDGSCLQMNLADLQTINPQVHEKLEMFYQGVAYRMTGSRAGVSALKWEVAVNAIWRRTGQKHKLSPYIRPEKERAVN